MRLALLIALAGCTEHGQTPDGGFPPGTDGGDPAVCEAQFQGALDRKCIGDGDCTLVDHDDCCGIVKIGIAAASASSYPAIESELQSCRPCPPLGCNHADQAEDGMVPQMGQAIVAVCSPEAVCFSTVR